MKVHPPPLPVPEKETTTSKGADTPVRPDGPLPTPEPTTTRKMLHGIRTFLHDLVEDMQLAKAIHPWVPR